MTEKGTIMQATATAPTRTEFGVTRQGTPIDPFLLRTALGQVRPALAGREPSMAGTTHGEVILAAAAADTGAHAALFTVIINPDVTDDDIRLLVEEPDGPATRALFRTSVIAWLHDSDPGRIDAALALVGSFIAMDDTRADAFRVIGAWLAWRDHDTQGALAYLRAVAPFGIHAALASETRTMVTRGVTPEQAANHMDKRASV